MTILAMVFYIALGIGLFAAVAAGVTVPVGLGIARTVCTRSQVYGQRKAFVRRIALITSVAIAILAGIGMWFGLLVLLNT